MYSSPKKKTARCKITVNLKFVGPPDSRKLENVKAILTDSYLERVEMREEERGTKE